MKYVETDVLVVGSGIAGLVAAKLIAPHGRVLIATKKQDTDSNTNYAQGGIAAVLSADDSPEEHIADTLDAGDGLCNRRAVELLVREGPQLVMQLMAWGARFNRTGENGPLELGKEGGHSKRRIVHAQDQTGREVERALLASLAREPNATIVEHRLAVALLVEPTARGKRCCGVVVYDGVTNKIEAYVAKATVLATGGIGRVYLHTTNPAIATGDGVAMAYRVGARVANLEFIQFHPTTFYSADAPDTFLISEAVRGEGALLRLKSGDTFMERYDPRGCLAPRDIVARAIDREMKASGDPCVYLDMTMLGREFIERRFPYINARCLEHGVDPARDWVPVVPAAHYVCGGVMADEHGLTNIDCLYATGEVACTGVHGANRLASNSLLEALVWSRRAAAHIIERLPALTLGAPEPPPLGARIEQQLERVRIHNCLDVVRRIMWDYVGIVRSNERLRLAHRRIEVVKTEVEGYIADGYLSAELVELWNIVEVADLIVRSALLRKESRGLHYNVDHPYKDDANWLQDTVLRKRG